VSFAARRAARQRKLSIGLGVRSARPGQNPSLPTRSKILSWSSYEWQVSGEESEPHFGSTRPPPVAGDRRLAGGLKIIAAILERPVIEKILTHLGLEPPPLPKTPTRELVLHHAA